MLFHEQIYQRKTKQNSRIRIKAKDEGKGNESCTHAKVASTVSHIIYHMTVDFQVQIYCWYW